MHIIRRRTAGVLGAVAAIVAPMTLGQAPASAQGKLPEIVVTAPKTKKAAPAKKAEPSPQIEAPPATEWTTQVRMAPAGGSELPLDKVPAGVTLVTNEQIARIGANTITDVLNRYVPGVTINETLGNPLAADLQYRGFSASPLNGTPQGLAIYQNGVRLNEVFGDSMNFDLIPHIAISDMTVMSNNPAYGLNALGGAVNIIMKDGFSYQGASIDTRFGSFGHKEVAGEAGQKVGNWSAYIAGEWIDETGWRDLSPAEAKRTYADIGVKGLGSEFHLNYTFADTHLGVVGPTPVEMLDENRSAVFTLPQSFDNRMHMVNLSGAVSATDTLKISGNAYYRSFSQFRPDGNVSEAVLCKDGVNLCFEDDETRLTGRRKDGTVLTNVPISSLKLPDGLNTVLGGIDTVSVASFSYGATLQEVSKARLFNRPNQFLIGASADIGRAHVTSQSELGILDPRTLVIRGTGIIIDQSLNPDLGDDNVEIKPVDLIARTQYYGLYVMNTLDVTDRLAVTAGGRYNVANIKLEDQLGDDLNGDHTFQRFNPMLGATYKLAPGLTVYAGYSESNRAPTPAELGCADPQRPCLLENFLVSDPPLKQVVGRTVEAGLRGELNAGYSGRDALGAPRANTIGWSLGYFRTLLSDDILTVASEVQGRGFFLNAGDTLREGVEAAVNYRSNRLALYASYAFVNATFRDALELPSPDNPAAGTCSGADSNDDDAPRCTHVRPGDRIPSIPQHRFKVGFDYWVSPQWRVGADLTAVSGQFLRGDEGNDDAQLPGYAVLDLRTGYKLADHIELYGIVRNLFGTDYATFGTYYDTEGLRTLGGAPAKVGPNGTELENPRMITPAAPIAVYGGVKMRF